MCCYLLKNNLKNKIVTTTKPSGLATAAAAFDFGFYERVDISLRLKLGSVKNESKSNCPSTYVIEQVN